MRVLVLCQDPQVVHRLAPLLPDFHFSPFPVGGPWDLVVRWGTDEGDDPDVRVLNPAPGVRQSKDRSCLIRLCQANRIPCAARASDPPAPGRYRVDLFDLSTIAVSRWDGNRYRLFPWRGSRRIGLLRQTARRALYAAGLHFGAVELGVSRSGVPHALRVSSGPRLSPYLARRYAEALRDYAQRVALRQRSRPPIGGIDFSSGATESDEEPSLREVVLGCDPEFVMRRIRTGRLVPASRFFTRLGQIGADRQAFFREGVRHYPVAELRPPPSPSPHVLTENLRRTILRAARIVRGRGIRFEAGSYGARGFPIGGHIHFSNLRPSTDLLRALDNYLALPLMLLEDPVAARMRRPRYGSLGDFRMQRHGGFEYRTPGSWIFSPEFALAVLCLAKIIATDYDLLRRDVLNSPEAQQDFYAARKARFRAVFPALWRDLTGLRSYQYYAAELAILHDLIIQERRWNENTDIRRRWLNTPVPASSWPSG